MANINENFCFFAGRLTADPELKQTTGGISVCSFNVAVQRPYRDDNGAAVTDFIPVVAWRQTAEFVCKYFRKGGSITVRGPLQSKRYTEKTSGQQRVAWECIAERVGFVDSRLSAADPASDGSDSAGAARPTAPMPGQSYTDAAHAAMTDPLPGAASAATFDDIPEDTGLPF